MKHSSQRFKALAVTGGFSFWFFIISSALGLFTVVNMLIFIIILAVVTQIFSLKLSRGLDIFARINTKIFVGLLFVFVLSIYGILFKFLRIDLLRLKKENSTYWLETDITNNSNSGKQY